MTMRVRSCRPIKPLALLLMMVTAWLSGCARMTTRPLDPAQSAAVLRAKNFNDPQLQRFLTAMGAQPTHQGDGYGLRALVLVAVYERPDLALAQGQVALARADLTTARALPNPVLSLTPSYNVTDGMPSPLKIGPIVNFIIGSFGTRRAEIGAASARYRAARLLIEQAMWRERTRVRDALITLEQARQRLALAAQVKKLAVLRYSLIKERYQHGMVAAPPVMQARLDAVQAQLQWARAMRRAALALPGLAAAVGVSPTSLAAIGLDGGATRQVHVRIKLGAAVQRALTQRPSIIAALDRYQAAQDQLRAAIDNQFPGVILGPGYHYDQGQSKYLLNFSLPLPIFNQNQGPIAAARAQRRIAAARFVAAQARALAQIRRAVADRAGSDAALKSANQLVAAAAQNRQSAQAASAQGAIGPLRVLAARRQWLVARGEALQADAMRLRAIAKLEDALHVVLFRRHRA